MSKALFLQVAACSLVLAAPGCAARSADPGESHQTRIFKARDRVLPALVHIEPILEVFRSGEKGKVAVTGSGVIFSPEGYILTNTHVVGGANRLTCTLNNQEEVEARLIGIDPLSDLAVIKIDMARTGEGVHHAPLGDSGELEAGQVVIAMGSPLGLARSLTMGVISSLNRYFPESQLPTGAVTGTYNTWIQTDAAINPGNSGGPLVDLAGDVIGINARAISVFGENLGFAIPINLAKEIATELIARGQIARSWVGISWQQVKGMEDYFGVREGQGALVGSVVPGSPADESGLKPGDVVTAINERPVAVRYEEDLPRLKKWIADLPIGESARFEYVREGRNLAGMVLTRTRPNVEAAELECREWGFTVQEITEEIAHRMSLEDRRGVVISGVKRDSFADEAGLQRNDIMLLIEGRPIDGFEEYKKIYEELVSSGRDRLLVNVRRGQLRTFHVLKPVYTPEEGLEEAQG